MLFVGVGVGVGELSNSTFFFFFVRIIRGRLPQAYFSGTVKCRSVWDGEGVGRWRTYLLTSQVSGNLTASVFSICQKLQQASHENGFFFFVLQ